MILPTVREKNRSPFQVSVPQAFLHSDAADMRYGVKFHTKIIQARIAGMWILQGVWRAEERAGNITHR